jgi:hypothetical protein
MTSLTSPGLSGSDVLSLYYGRGGFEKLLGDEDAEQDSDRWCSWHPQGQEFWQILNQWVWNWRLWAGLAYQPIVPRETLWSPSPPESLSLTDGQTLTDEPLKLTESPEPSRLVHHSEDEYGEMQVTGGWARSRNKFSGDDFTLLDERTLKCPASHLMYRREVRHNRYGDLLILFGINPRTCQQCSLKSQCLADGSKGTGGRRITVIRKKKRDNLALDSELTLNPAPISSHLTPTPRKIDDPNRPVLWLDFPTTQLRRNLTHQLRHQQIIFESTNCTTSANQMPVPLITRDQRAHRRLSWSQRWERNSLKETETHWQVTLFGLSSTILNWLQGLQSIADVAT